MPSERAVARADGEGGGGEPSFEKVSSRLDHRCVPPGMAHALSLKKTQKSYVGERFTTFTKGSHTQ